MLTEHGIETHFVTSKGFEDKVPDNVEVHAVLPYSNPKEIKKAAEPILKDMGKILTHDIVYLEAYADHVQALRQIPGNYIHWSHSAPGQNVMGASLPGLYVCMNYTDLPLLAKQFNIPESQCRVVYNPVSPDNYFGWHPFTSELVKKHDLLDCDVLVTYPLDTGRFQSKGGFKVIKLLDKIRKKGTKAKVVFVNAAANTKERTTFVKALTNENVIFTSLENDKYIVSVPRQVVRELFQISNLFPLLSDSEGCSLVLLEAALAKNLVVLNEDFPPLREFGEIDHTLYMKVSSTRCTTNYNPNEDQYYDDYANIIINTLNQDKANRFNRKVLRQFNRHWIWDHQLQPLLS